MLKTKSLNFGTQYRKEQALVAKYYELMPLFYIVTVPPGKIL